MSIKNYKMRTKILLLSTTLFLIFTVFVSAYIIPTTTKSIEAQNKTRLINLVDICYSTAEKYHTAFLNGEIEESVAKERAIAEIRSFRYGNGDYFFINGYNNISIMHPLNLALEGQDLTGLEDPNGVMIFQEMNKVVTKEGSGFVNYVWDKPGSNTPQPKLTYVKGFDDWGWIIGTGVYIDDLTAIKMTLIRNVVISLGLIILASIIISIKMSSSISKPLVELKNIAEKISKGDIDIEIDTSTKDEVGDLSRSFENVITSIKNVISETNILEEKISKGYLDSQADSSKFTGGWNSIVSGTNNVSRILEKHLRSVPAIIMAIDTEYNVLYLNDAGLSFMDTKSKDEIMRSKCYDLFCTNDCRTSDCACSMSFADGSSHSRETTARPDGKELEITYNAVPIKDKNGKIHGAFELIIDQTDIKMAEKYQAEQLIIQEEEAKLKDKQSLYQSNEVKKLLTSINKLAQGNLNLSISASEHDEDTKEISELFTGIYASLHEMTTSIKSYIDEISIILAKLSSKDFDVEIKREYKGDFTTMKKSINELVESFNSKLWEINEASKQVLMGTNQVSQSSQSLSQGATEQASSIEQISTTMSSVLEQTKSNAQNAIKANELSNQIHTYAESGSSQMGQMLRSMDDINEASNNISRIIKVIDDIAFQTNILALNAAVEAARAGQYGKGFAVVAEEVRNLAERSKNAARETTDMIESTIQKVQIGTEIANDTSAALEKIVTSVKASEILANEIATLSGSQTEAITQVNSGIVEISTVIQQNVALAEESAATSQEMASQAHMLNQIAEEYKLKDTHGHRENTAIYEEISTSMID